jgi:hypothetical protein
MYDAVPVVIEEALNPSLNGVYDPMDDTSDDWPCYRKRDGEEDIWMVFNRASDSWLIRRATASWVTGTGETVFEKGFLAKLFTNPPAFPELRLQGENGIEEIVTSFRPHVGTTDERSSLQTNHSYEGETTVTVVSRLSVITEEEFKARALMETLKNAQRT